MAEATWFEPFERRYKYRTTEEKTYTTGWRLPKDVSSKVGFVHLSAKGTLTIKSGYAWDGASGPTLDTPSTMFASLVHDALYQLMREGVLDQGFRLLADEILGRIMLDSYRGKWTRWHACRVHVWVWAVKKLAAYAAEPD